MNIGDKVEYIAFKGSQPEKGIIKSLHEDKDKIFVVYHCNEEWNNYKNYTGQLTPIDKLKIGWS